MEKIKHLMMEPRRGEKSEFDELLNQFYAIIENTATPGEERWFSADGPNVT